MAGQTDSYARFPLAGFRQRNLRP